MAKFDTINQPNNDLQKLIDERFDKIEENIDNLITKKIAENTQMEVKDIEAKIDAAIHQTKSYAATLQTMLEASNLTNIIKETKNEKLVDKKRRELRSTNLTIYDGIREEPDDQMELKRHDEQLITSFLDTIGLTLKPKQIIRLGKPNEDKKIPIKLVMSNVAEKDIIMVSLGNLKNAEDIYRQLSVHRCFKSHIAEIKRFFIFVRRSGTNFKM